MTIRLAAAAYSLPPTVETVESILERERDRADAGLAGVGHALRIRVLADLGIERVRSCGSSDPYDLIPIAARAALAEADIDARAVDLIIDYSTLPGHSNLCQPLAHRLSSDLGAETSLNLSFKLGGCAGFHLAVKQACALMRTDDRLRHALLVAADSPPPGNRSLLPVTIQGDAGSAVVLCRDSGQGPEILATEVLTLGHLRKVISLESGPGGCGLELRIDPRQLEEEVLPIYYLHFHRLVHKILDDAHIGLEDISHVVYSNLSGGDRDGFCRALGIPKDKAQMTKLAECGHTFASDMVLNYTDLTQAGLVKPGQFLLFASAGVGFSWGVTLARA